MAYIGNQPTDNFVTFATQNFSTSATSSYTLSHAVSNENEIALFINNVRQHPGSGKAYTASGTALTLSANTALTDVMYCIFLGRAIQSTVPATNSITAAMVSANAVTGAKLNTDVISAQTALTSSPADTDELLISDAGVLKRIDVSLVGGKNTPTFLVYKNGDQSISANADTKITSYTEIHDPQSTFASNKFTPGVSGKYWIFGTVYLDGTDGKLFIAKLKKNGSTFAESGTTAGTSAGNFPILVSGLIDLDTDDYVELFFQPAANTTAFSSGTTVQFGGYKIIE